MEKRKEVLDTGRRGDRGSGRKERERVEGLKRCVQMVFSSIRPQPVVLPGYQTARSWW